MEEKKEYQVSYYYTLKVEAKDIKEAQKIADEITSKNIINFNDLSCEIEKIN